MEAIQIPGLSIPALDDVLSGIVGSPARVVDVTELGASSRATPWRIDVEVGATATAYLLRHAESVSANEVVALEAMTDHPIPTPRVVYWDEDGTELGTPLFLSDFIQGEPLLPPMIAEEPWAIDLYIDTACALQDVSADDLPADYVNRLPPAEPIRDTIESAYRRFPEQGPLHNEAYQRLIDSEPPALPEPAFSNGDLWPDNLLVKNRRLVGVIDWQHAGWTDPLFEFMLPFFLVPELRNRGIEERYCERKAYDAAVLHWYHGVEFFDSLSYVEKLGKPYEMHTGESLRTDLTTWLSY